MYISICMTGLWHVQMDKSWDFRFSQLCSWFQLLSSNTVQSCKHIPKVSQNHAATSFQFKVRSGSGQEVSWHRCDHWQPLKEMRMPIRTLNRKLSEDRPFKMGAGKEARNRPFKEPGRGMLSHKIPCHHFYSPHQVPFPLPFCRCHWPPSKTSCLHKLIASSPHLLTLWRWATWL